MIFTRTAGKILKSSCSSVTFRYSCLAHLTGTPCRSINTERNHAKLALFGKPSADVMDRFIGLWEQKDTPFAFSFLMEEAGIAANMNRVLEKFKSWEGFSREDDVWTYRHGFEKMDMVKTVSFKLGEPIISEFYDGSPVQTVFELQGKKLVEIQKTLLEPILTCVIKRSVKDDKMEVVVATPGHVMSSVFIRA